MITADRPDGLVLDVMMPRLDGLEVCRQLRSTGDDLPILVLTARDTISERVAGLDAGADDYLPKPFALEELLARMRALLRRTRIEDAAESVAMTFADLTLDSVTREVTRGQRQISLTRTEFALLEMLIANPRRVLTRSRILEEVWGFDFPTSGNALEVYVGYLRRKTEAERRAAADPHRARCGLRASRNTSLMPLKTLFRLQSRRPLRTSTSLSLRWRVMLLAMSMVAMVVILMAVAVYAVISAALYNDIDNQLQSRAQLLIASGSLAADPAKAIEGTAYSDVNAMLVTPGRSIFTANQEGQTLPVGQQEKAVDPRRSVHVPAHGQPISGCWPCICRTAARC